MVDFFKNDIVRLRGRKFDELRDELWFKDNAFVVTEMKPDGMVTLWELEEDVPQSQILPVPINEKRYGNIYYDPPIAASFVGEGEDLPVHNADESFFMDAFKRSYEEDGTTLFDLVEKQGFMNVHEVQHWLREKYQNDNLKIRHLLKDTAEVYAGRLWSLRNELLATGLSPYQYLYEISNMLYLKLLTFDETDKGKTLWDGLKDVKDEELLSAYRQVLSEIEQQTRIISESALRQALNVVDLSAHKEAIADVFDKLLVRNFNEGGSGAVQYFTPKVLAQLMVELMEPQVDERWFDPAAGMFGILVEIERYLREHNANYQNLAEYKKYFQIKFALSGKELQKEIARIGYCNTRFHKMECEVGVGDSLLDVKTRQYDGIICEPPVAVFTMFNTNKGIEGVKNKQLAFVDWIVNSLIPDGQSRAAILMPEGFLKNSSTSYVETRKLLMDKVNLHTILRLPSGIYPHSAAKMCVLLLNYSYQRENGVWVYDMSGVKVSDDKRDDVHIFDQFLKEYRGGTKGENWHFVTKEYLQEHYYVISSPSSEEEGKVLMQQPRDYLMEANRLEREIRALLRKLEKTL